MNASSSWCGNRVSIVIIVFLGLRDLLAKVRHTLESGSLSRILPLFLCLPSSTLRAFSLRRSQCWRSLFSYLFFINYCTRWHDIPPGEHIVEVDFDSVVKALESHLMPGVFEVCLFCRSISANIYSVVEYLSRSKISYCLSCPESTLPKLLWSVGRYHQCKVIIEEHLAVSRELYVLFDIIAVVAREVFCDDEERSNTILSDVFSAPLVDIVIGEYMPCIESCTSCRSKSGAERIFFLIVVAEYFRSEPETIYLDRTREIGLYFVVYGQWSDSGDGLDL